MAFPTTDTDTPELNPGETDYNRRFNNDIYTAEQRGTVTDDTATNTASPGGSGTTSGIDDLRNGEGNPPGGWVNNTASQSRSGKAGFLVSPKRKKGPLIGIILSILVGGGGGISLLGPVIAPITFFENITDDLNDQLSALDIREGYLFRNRLPSADRKEAIKGCSKLSIRCKFATINEKQALRLKSSGIDVTPSTGSGLLGKRIKPTNYKFRGVDYAPDEWAKQLKTDPNAQHAQRRANNMKFLSTDDPTYARMLKRFGITKKPPELKGSVKDRVNALLDKASASSPKDLAFKPTGEKDKNGKPTFTLEGDTNNTVYSEAQKVKMESSIAHVVAAKPPSKATKASIGALSVLGYWDLGCSIKNMLTGATVAAKIASQQEQISFAMKFASLTGKMKAGDASPEDVQALGEFMTDKDNRAKIVDVRNSIASTSTENGTTVSDTLATMDNPDFGKSAMDSSLYEMSAGGGVPAPSSSLSQFSLGLGQNQLLKGLSDFTAVADVLVNVGDANACHWIQSPIVRGLGTISSVVLAVGSGGGSLVQQAVVAGSMMGGIMILDTLINNALDGSLIKDASLEDSTVNRGTVLWTAMSGIYGNAAQQRALMPGNSEQVAEYVQLQNKTKQDYIAMESETANPLDIYSQYSFLGSFTRSLLKTSSSSLSPMSALNNVSSVVSSGFGSLTGQYSTYAAAVDQTRFKQCDDSSYEKLGIDADVQCNVRYVMPSEDLALDTDDVAAWMEENNCGGTGTCVETETTTGFPAGYTPPDPAETQSAVMGFVKSVTDTVVNTRPLPNDYAKFLDYCVYRALPFGETGEENSAFRDDNTDWKDGSNCLKLGAPYSYYRIYTLDKSLLEATDEEPIDSTEKTVNTDPIVTLPGSATELAKLLIANTKVTDKTGQVKEIADGSRTNVDPGVLQVLVQLGLHNTYSISSMKRDTPLSGGAGNKSLHLSGRAVDLSGSSGVNGVSFGYNGHNAKVQEFINQAVSIMPAGCNIGLPNQAYVNATRPLVKSGCYVFVDDKGTAPHIHLDIGGGS